MASHSKKPKAFITGINGFTGRYMSAELAEAGYEVYGTVSNNTLSSPYNVFPVDITKQTALWETLERIEPDVVIHLAAIAFVAHDNAEDIYRTNVMGTRQLLAGLARLSKKPHSVLLASSANIYGNANVPTINEQTPISPANDYGVSKYAMELMANLWGEQLPITIVRPFNYTGVGQARNYLLPKIVEHFVQKKSCLELGNLYVERDWSDVRDVVHKYRLLLEQPSTAGKVFNVCSGVPHSLNNLIEMMSSIANHQLEVSVNPAFVRANEVSRLLGDETLLRKTVSLNVARPLEETLRWMYDSGV